MELSRGDVRTLEPTTVDAVLRELGVGRDAWLATGTEAEVYRLDDERVLKLYKGQGRATKLDRTAEVAIARRWLELDADVTGLTRKRARLRDLCREPHDSGKLDVIHGDFCLGNVLVD